MEESLAHALAGYLIGSEEPREDVGQRRIDACRHKK